METSTFANDYRRTPYAKVGRATKVLPKKAVPIGTVGSTTTLVKDGAATITTNSKTVLDFRESGKKIRVGMTIGREKTKP